MYETTGYGSGWLHRTADGCKWGTYLLLRDDGTAIEVEGSKRTGRWEGDEFHFNVSLEKSRYYFTRAVAQPSQ